MIHWWGANGKWCNVNENLLKLRGLVVTFGASEVVGIVVVHHHLAHVPVHLALLLAHELVERQITAGGALKLEENFVVFQTGRPGRKR